MSYAGNFIKARGQECTIIRDPSVTSYVSLKRSSKSISDLTEREAYFEGLILSDSNIESGELFQIGDNKYLVQTVYSDPASSELVLFAVKTNVVIDHKTLTKSADENYDITEKWSTVNSNVDAFGLVINDDLRQEEPGLVQGSTYIFQVPKSLGIAVMDRIVLNGSNYKVISVDNIGLDGVSRIQSSVDTRP